MRQALAKILLLPLLGCMAVSAAAATSDTITIENGGSTNTAAYQIAVTPDGEAHLGESRAVSLPKELFDKLKYDVTMAMPLHGLKSRSPCVKSASFGTAIYFSLGEERSGDLTCPARGAEEAEALVSDANAIAKFLGMGGPRRPEGQ